MHFLLKQFNLWVLGCVLILISCFSQVLFAEPVVITACEFLEQNASSASQAVSLVGYVKLVSFLQFVGLFFSWELFIYRIMLVL